MSRPDRYVSQSVEAARLFQNTSSAVYGEPATHSEVTFGDVLLASGPHADANLPPLGPSNTVSYMASPPMLAAPVHHAACTISVHHSPEKTFISAAPQYLADLDAPATVTYDIPAQTCTTTITATPLPTSAHLTAAHRSTPVRMRHRALQLLLARHYSILRTVVVHQFPLLRLLCLR